MHQWARVSLEAVTARHELPQATGLRERIALSLLRTAAELAPQREAMFARIAAQPPGPYRDKALGDLTVGAWMEKPLLWLGWRLLPGTSLTEGFSTPTR